MSKPINPTSAESLLNLCAEHGMSEVLTFLADHYRSLPECFDKPMTACVNLATAIDALDPLADAADAELACCNHD